VAAKLCPVVNYQAVLGLDLGGRIGPAGVIPAPYTERVRDPRALNIGDRGPRVAQVQQALILAGAFLVRDGIYGRATRAAVESYQHSKGLTVDGIVGPATLAALGV
jgi:peptidoglycan hydrolase-like protein with peptidoglycan-binding domain